MSGEVNLIRWNFCQSLILNELRDSSLIKKKRVHHIPHNNYHSTYAFGLRTIRERSSEQIHEWRTTVDILTDLMQNLNTLFFRVVCVRKEFTSIQKTYNPRGDYWHIHNIKNRINFLMKKKEGFSDQKTQISLAYTRLCKFYFSVESITNRNFNELLTLLSEQLSFYNDASSFQRELPELPHPTPICRCCIIL
jgi:hypothetical protein